MIDRHPDDVFVRDRQQPFWLFKYVKAAGPGELPKNTPASLVLRAFSAFSERYGSFCLTNSLRVLHH